MIPKVVAHCCYPPTPPAICPWPLLDAPLLLPPPPGWCCAPIDLTPGNIMIKVSDAAICNIPHARCMEGAPYSPAAYLSHRAVTRPFHRLQAGQLCMPPPCAALLLTLCSRPSPLTLFPTLSLVSDKAMRHGFWGDYASYNFPDNRCAATAYYVMASGVTMPHTIHTVPPH